MASNVWKAEQITATTDANGTITLNGQVPNTWTDVLGAVVSPVDNNPGNLVAVRCKPTGTSSFLVTCFQRNADSSVSKCANTQCTFMFVLYGVQ